MAQIDEKVQRISASETNLVIKIENLFKQTIENIEQENVKSIILKQRLTAPYMAIT